MKKILLSLLIVVVLSSLIYAVTGLITSFNNQDNPFDINLTANKNSSYTLSLPLNTYITNISMNLTLLTDFTDVIDYVESINTNNETYIWRYTDNTNSTTHSLLNFTFYDSGADTYSTGKYGKQLVFDESYFSKINFTTDPHNVSLSFMTFISPSEDASAGDIVFLYTRWNTNYVRLQVNDASNLIYCRMAQDGAEYEATATYSDIKDSHAWVTCVFEAGNNVSLYVNKTQYLGDNIPLDSFQIDGNMTVGAGGAGGDRYDGTVDELLIFYNHSLTWDQLNNTIDEYDSFGSKYITVNSSGLATWIYNGTLSTDDTIKISAPITEVNNVLEGNCNCSKCKTSGLNCIFPIDFYSSTNAKININLTNASYQYGLDDCSNGFPLLTSAYAKNISFYDEGNNTPVIADVDGLWNYSIDNHATYGTYTKDTNDIYNFSICIYPSYAELDIIFDVDYENLNDYLQRTWSGTDTYDSITENINLSMLFVGQGIYARFKTVDEYENILTGTSAKMELNGVVIEESVTDGTGIVTFFVDPDTTYTFTFTKTGYETQTFSARITTGDIFTVIMPQEATASDPPLNVGLLYNFAPTNVTLNNHTTYNFVFNATTSVNTITDCNLTLLLDNQTVLQEGTGTFDADSCTITLAQTTWNWSNIISKGFVQINGTSNNTMYRTYQIGYFYQGTYSLKTIFQDIRNFGGAGFNDFSRMLITFFFIFIIVAGVSRAAGLTNPEAIMLVVVGLVWVASFLDLLLLTTPNFPAAIGGVPIGAFMQKFSIALLITMTVGAYIIARHR